MNIEQGIISKINSKEDYLTILNERITKDFFEEHGEVFQAIASHHSKYKTVPEKETLQKAFPNFQFYEGEEPLQFFIDKIKAQYKKKLYTTALPKVAELLPVDIDAAERELQKLVTKSKAAIKTGNTLDFSNSAEHFKSLYSKRASGLGVDGYSTSWPFLDRLTCGYHGGELIIWMGRAKFGKGISLEQELPTPKGFVKAKNIACGDYLFGSNGTPTKVINISDVHNIECFKVIFNDKTSLTTDKEHRWLVYKSNSSTRSKTPIILTTQELYEEELFYKKNSPKRTRFAIPLTKPVEYSEKELPVHPYALGLWLGDGISREARISVGKEDKDDILSILKSFGIDTTLCKDNRDNFVIGLSSGKKGTKKDSVQSRLKTLGVINNKHIPEEYMFGSIEQRLSLLRGLMDSDGSAEPSPVFYNTNKSICDKLLELVYSLGGRGYVGDKITTLNGKKHNSFVVYFQLPMSAFLLKRKKAKERLMQRPYRYITNIEPIYSEPTICFMVDAKDSLYLVGKEYIVTHNSWLLTWQMHHIWLEERANCLYITKEMGNDAIGMRNLAIDLGYSFDAIRRGQLTAEQHIKLNNRLDEIEEKMQSGEYAKLGIHGFDLLDGTSGVSAIIPKVEEYLADGGGVLFIDGMYLIPDDRGEIDWRGIVNVATDLKILAQTYDIPVIVTTQQSMEDKSDVPRLENAAYGKYIVQYADLILGGGRSDIDRKSNLGHIYVLGQREGDLGEFTINMKFDPIDFSQSYEKTVDDYDEDDDEDVYHV